MSINVNRQAARLAKSKENGKAVLQAVSVGKHEVESITYELGQLQVKIKLLENQVAELGSERTEREAAIPLEADAEKQDDLRAEIAALTRQLATVDEQIKAESATYSERRARIDVLQHKLFDVERGPVMVSIANQEAALQRRELSYPTKLKRHLIKCRKHGWADARLTGGKK